MTNNEYNQHIKDYIQFNAEQMEWFDDMDKRQMLETSKWIADYLSDFPIELEYNEPPK